MLYLLLQFYYKGYTNQDWPKEEKQAEAWEGPEHRASMPSPHGIGAYHPPGTLMCSTRKCHQASWSRDFIGVSLCRHD